jgi:integrase/recombinase XerD
MALLLYTTCRREDAVRLGPQHVRNGRVKFRQAKNEHRNPVDIDIPLHSDLAAILGATPSGHMTFLTTEYGRPFSPAGFGNRFREWCNQAGLPHCSAHGLRKATATRLAERGATPHEIMSVTGHRSLEEVERYTRKAQKSTLADSAMSKFKG